MKNNNNTVIVIIVLVVMALLGYWYMNNPGAKSTDTSNTLYPTYEKNPVIPSAASGQGRAVIVIKDAAASIENVSSIAMTVDKVEVHKVTSGWATVSAASKTYDLLALKKSNVAMLLADANIAAGTYGQIRLHVSKVMVTASGKVTEAKLPSNYLRIVGNFTLIAGETSAATIDILADKSLHLTGSGKYILAPVIHFQTETGSSVSVKSNGSVDFDGGKPETDITVGMDETGQVKANFELKADVDLDAENHIRLNGAPVVPSVQGDASATGSVERSNAPVPVILNFVAQNNSGVSGTATLMTVDGKVKAELKTSGGILALISPSEPAHIHTGTCADLGAVKYSLANVTANHSVTVVDVSMAALKAELPLAINIHKSAKAIGTYIACVDLKF